MESSKEMIERLQNEHGAGPSRQELEANIKIAHNWITAVSSGTYQGHQSLHIATLLDFLKQQHDKNVQLFEAEVVKHPEWKKPEAVEK